MNIQTPVKSSRETNDITETTEMAKETTLLSPRFYTTDFSDIGVAEVNEYTVTTEMTEPMKELLTQYGYSEANYSELPPFVYLYLTL